MSEDDDDNEKQFNPRDFTFPKLAFDFEIQLLDFNSHSIFDMEMIQKKSDDQEEFSLEKDPLRETQSNVKEVQIDEKTGIKERSVRLIQVILPIRIRYLFMMKGSPSETMELNINFKTRFCQKIRQLIDLKVIGREEKELFQRYKFQSPSFKSLVSFLNSSKNIQSKKMLRQLMNSSQIVSCILQSDLRMESKLAMVKFLEVMRSAVMSAKKNQKWK